MTSSSFTTKVTKLFSTLKYQGLKLPIRNGHKICGHLRLITYDILNNDKEITLLLRWRVKHQKWFPSQFKVTFARTKRWTKEQLLDKEDRILFFIESNENPIKQIGHLGLNRFNYKDHSCQIDNVIRGTAYTKGMMTYALQTLIDFSFKNIGIKYLTLTTFAHNQPAIALYRRCGFKTSKKIPLEKEAKKGEIVWIPKKSKGPAERFNLEMILKTHQRKKI